MRTIRKVSSVAIMGALLLIAVTPAAFAGKYFNFTFPLSGTFTEGGACGGDTFSLSGSAHFLGVLQYDGAGGYHAIVHDNFGDARLTNVATGEVCVGPNSNEAIGGYIYNISGPSYQSEYTTEVHGAIICPGPRDNDSFHLIAHFTVNANGDVTADISDLMFVCDR